MWSLVTDWAACNSITDTAPAAATHTDTPGTHPNAPAVFTTATTPQPQFQERLTGRALDPLSTLFSPSRPALPLTRSRGFKDAAAAKGADLEAALLKASEGGKIPIVMDTSPCLAQVGVRGQGVLIMVACYGTWGGPAGPKPGSLLEQRQDTRTANALREYWCISSAGTP